jgi:spore coat protein U-like protein
MTVRDLIGSCCFLVGALLVAASPAQAIVCQWRGTSPVSFGSYDVFSGTPNDANGSVTLRCNAVKGELVTIDLSTGGSGTYFPRRMTRAGVETLDYNLYLDATRTQIWGNATGGTLQYGPTVPPSNTNVLINIYGRIPAGQDKSAGNYTDTITATVNY